VFLWPYLAVVLERTIYDVPSRHKSWWQFWKKSGAEGQQKLDDNLAISVKHLKKTFKSSWFSSKTAVMAVDDLSLDIPKTGIFVLLGSNGCVISPTISRIFNQINYLKCWKIYLALNHRWPSGTNKRDHHLRRWCLSPSSWDYGNCTTEECTISGTHVYADSESVASRQVV